MNRMPFLSEYNLMVLNDGSPTRIADNSETTIDLSLCYPSISFNFDWSVFQSALDSDHCPVVVEIQDNSSVPLLPSWNLKRADWHKFSSSTT